MHIFPKKKAEAPSPKMVFWPWFYFPLKHYTSYSVFISLLGEGGLCHLQGKKCNRRGNFICLFILYCFFPRSFKITFYCSQSLIIDSKTRAGIYKCRFFLSLKSHNYIIIHARVMGLGQQSYGPWTANLIS
jgi:hypothetical protein